jgi:hypothetical protein
MGMIQRHTLQMEGISATHVLSRVYLSAMNSGCIIILCYRVFIFQEGCDRLKGGDGGLWCGARSVPCLETTLNPERLGSRRAIPFVAQPTPESLNTTSHFREVHLSPVSKNCLVSK